MCSGGGDGEYERNDSDGGTAGVTAAVICFARF
jgi:hypothetical protein